MKQTFILIALSFAIVTNGWSQAEILVKQKAEKIRDANNARQAAIAGPSAPAAAAPPAPGMAAPPSGMPLPPGGAEQMKLVNQLAGDFFALKAGETITADRSVSIANDLLALSKVGLKPSKELVAKLSQSVVQALSEKVLPANEIRSICGCLSGVMNSSQLPATAAAGLITRTENILKGAGVSSDSVTAVSKNMSDIVTFMQKGKSKLYN